MHIFFVRPNELAQDVHIEAFLSGTIKNNMLLIVLERITASKNAMQWKKTQLASLASELPSDVQKLKELCLDLLINQNVFEERCKVSFDFNHDTHFFYLGSIASTY